MKNEIEKMRTTATDIIRFILLFLLALAVIAPVIGTVYIFFGWHWGRGAFIINVLLSLFLACYLYRIGMFQIQNLRECVVLLIITIVSLKLYSQYSPVLNIAQDPSLYMLRALNLVNYGHDYKPMLTYNYFIENGIINPQTEYGMLHSGTYFSSPNLHCDFFPGGSFFYSLFGLISKDIIFYGQTAVMLINSWLMYFAIKKISGIKSCAVSGIYTLTFIVAPLIVWFGRGSFTEPVALLFLLLIMNILAMDKSSPVLLALCFLASYSARMDYFIILLIGIFIILYIHIPTGILYTGAVVGQVFLYRNVYECYFSRISNEMRLFKYQIPIVLAVFVISFLFVKWKRELLPEILYSKWVKYLLIGIGLLCIGLMFYDNIVPEDSYQVALIHGQMMRTYKEECLDLLFLVFPSIILCLGLAGMYKFIDQERLNFVTSVFLLGVGVVYLYLLFGGANSPMLYWLLRRYYNNIIPISLLAFCCFFHNLHKNHAYFLAGACMLLSLNLYLNSGQCVDYDGLDKSISEIESDIKEQGYITVYYPASLKKEVSPLFGYSDLEFVPIDFNEYRRLKERKEDFDLSNSLIIATNQIEGMDPHIYNISYLKLGETYGEIPKTVYENNREILAYPLDEYVCNGNAGNIYPMGFTKEITGITDDQWTASVAEIICDDLDIMNDSELVIELKEYYNYYIAQGDMESLNLEVIVNDNYCLDFINYDGNNISFALDKLKESEEKLNKIRITCNTFSPFETGRDQDDRDLGIAINQIYVQ